MLKNLPKGLVDAVKLIIETTVPVQTRHVQQFDEELKGNQHKIDANKNGKIDAHDFKLLRRKKAVKEALESGVDVSDIVQFHSPMQSDLHEEIAVVVHRDARDGTIHVMAEGMKYKLKKDQVKEVSEELLGENNYKTAPTSYEKGSKEEEQAKKKDKMVANVLFGKKKTNEETDLTESTYEFDISGEHGNAAVDELVKHANSKGIKAKVHTYDGPGGGNPVIHLSHKDPKVVHDYVKNHIDSDVDLSDHKINEEVEQVDELSIDTMKSYGDKRARTAFSGGRKPGQSVDAGIKMKSQQSNSLSLARTKINRVRDTGSTVLNKEEVEELDELSKDTVQKYKKAAVKDYYDADDVDDGRRVGQRYKGIKMANRKLAKEEVEEIDELSQNKLTDYRAAAKKQGTNIQNKMKIGGGDWSKDGSETKTLSKRMAGYKMAGRKINPGISASVGKGVKVPANEEVETIDELSNKTLASYVSKASKSKQRIDQKMDDLDNARRVVSNIDVDDRTNANALDNQLRKASNKLYDKSYNRKAGMHQALKKLANEELEIEEGMEFEFEDRGIATVVEITENRIILAFDEGVEEFSINDIEFEELDEAHDGYKADSEKSKFNSGHRAKLMNPEGKVSYLSGKSYKTPAHAKAAAKFYGSIMHLPIRTMDSEMSQYNKSYDAKHGDVKEEVEIDENLSKLSKVDLINNYHKSKNALGRLGQTPYEDREDSGWDERVKHHKDILDSHMAELKRREVKEEVEIDEARGRPPKAPKEGQKPSPAWQRHLERQNKGEDKEELEALGAQLRKAVSINKPVTFLNGEKKEVSPSHITKFEDHMEARPKTIDKQKFQNDAHASHDAFVKSVTAPVPKPEGGTSSIVKYR